MVLCKNKFCKIPIAKSKKIANGLSLNIIYPTSIMEIKRAIKLDDDTKIVNIEFDIAFFARSILTKSSLVSKNDISIFDKY